MEGKWRVLPKDEGYCGTDVSALCSDFHLKIPKLLTKVTMNILNESFKFDGFKIICSLVQGYDLPLGMRNEWKTITIQVLCTNTVSTIYNCHEFRLNWYVVHDSQDSTTEVSFLCKVNIKFQYKHDVRLLDPEALTLNALAVDSGASVTGRLPREKASPATVSAFPICTTNSHISPVCERPQARQCRPSNWDNVLSRDYSKRTYVNNWQY